MTRQRSIAARLSYRLVSGAPAGTVGRARTARRLAPLLEAGFAAVGRPLHGRVVSVADGPARGLRLLGERRSLAWLSGRVEQDVQTALTRYLRPGGTFVDAGASIGFFSLLGARLVGPTGVVMALEPQRAAAASARRNAALNDFANVTVVECALSSASGEVLLEGTGKATAHVLATSRVGATRVASTTLDAILSERALAPDLVKIDVEGHERDVLAGMRATLVKRRPVVVLECHGTSVELLEPFHDAGYAVSVLGSDVPAEQAPPASHLLALPPGG